jgi:zinc/manganese transport system substrate-binding protein
MKLRVLLLTLGLTFFSVTASAQVQVVSTLPWIGSLAGDIGKDKVRVSILVKASQDPHFVEPKPSMILEVRKADLLMINGLDLEVGYLPVLLQSSRNPRIQPGNQGYLDCSQFIVPIDPPAQLDRSMGDVHPQGNPHYHLSPKNMVQVAQGIAERLSSLDPPNSGVYRSNLEELKERFRAKQSLWATMPLKGKRFVAYHRFFEYLARDFGFEIVAYVEPKPGIPPSAAHVETLVALVKQTKVDAILTTSYYGKKEGAFLSEATGVKYVVVPHDVGADDTVRDCVSLIDQALKSLQ